MQSPAKNVKEAGSGIRNLSVKGLCPHSLALLCVVLAKLAIKGARLLLELRADVASDDGGTADCQEDGDDPGSFLLVGVWGVSMGGCGAYLGAAAALTMGSILKDVGGFLEVVVVVVKW